MNIHPAVQSVIDHRAAQNNALQGASDTSARDAANLDKHFTLLAVFLDHMIQELQEGTLKTVVQNHPPVQPIAGSVQIDKAEALEEKLDQIYTATVDNKTEPVPLQEIKGTVSVDNFPPEKEISFPEYPRQIKTDVVSLPKYVGDKLDELKKAVQSLPAPIVNVPPQPTPQVHVDLQSVVNELEIVTQLLGTLAAYEAKDEPLDLTPLVQAVESVQSTIKNQKFPVPNFQSSWQHSRQMQALDGDMTYHWADISTPSASDGLTTHRLTDYLQVTLGDGVYRQTFTYDVYGNVTAKTAWVKQ